jgi:hypothetical protein
VAPRALSDAAWIEICQAAKLMPDADARAEMSACLFVEYQGMVYDRKCVEATLRRSKRMLKLINSLAALYQDMPAPRGDAIKIKHQRDLYYLDRLRQRALSHILGCQALRRANHGQSDSQYEWLISRLCGIWLTNFNGQHLGVSRPSKGGKPCGPVIRFLLAAVRQIIPPRLLPDPETLKKAIERERAERENARQLGLQLKQRRNGGLTRKENF